MKRTIIAGLALSVGASTALGQETTETSLAAALAAQRHAIRLTADGHLEGAGAELLLREGQESQFFLIGEEHGVAEVPKITAALYRALQPAGYRHLAIEIGRDWADTLNVLAGRPDAEANLVDFYNRYPPGALFYTLREEAALLIDVLAASGGRRDVLWGLDYDIVGDRYPLRRLRSSAVTPDARAALDRTIALADSLFAKALAAGNPVGILLFSGPASALASVREAYGAPSGSEADLTLSLLERTLEINRLFLSGQAYESNRRRAQVAKSNFMTYYTAAAATTARPPRVMFKYGANHMMRGRSSVEVFDLGNLASELAAANGSKSFHLMVMAGPGTQMAGFDPRTFGWTTQPAGLAGSEWTTPLVEAANGDEWTLYDLRPLRPLVGTSSLADLHPRMERTIFAFDAVLVLAGSSPSTALPVETGGSAR